jgi:hypothetical protein
MLSSLADKQIGFCSGRKYMWSKKHSECIICETTEKRHHSKGMCKNCYQRVWCEENSEKIKKKNKKLKEENPEKYKERNRKKYHKNKEKNIERSKRSSEKRKKEDLEEYKKARKKSSEKWYKNNSEKVKKYCKKYCKENPERTKKYQREYVLKKLHTNPHFKLKCNISTSIWTRLRKRLSSKKGKSTWNFLPYTVDDLIQHLEELFAEGMSWDNYGKWHVDHKKPDSLFNYKNVDDEEFQKCWALENLQPLWAKDNQKKSNKYQKL